MPDLFEWLKLLRLEIDNLLGRDWLMGFVRVFVG